MMEFIKQYWSEILTLLISAIALYLAVKSWQKNRNIYDLEHYFYKRQGNNETYNKQLKEKLQSGEYTILNTNYEGGDDFGILLGKIKK